MKYRTILLFGAPGSGKGTQGKALGTLPGFYHCSSGDIFRSLDPNSATGKECLSYSSKGHLVPDQLTIALWSEHMEQVMERGLFNPETDLLILDGIPRSPAQAEMLADRLEVLHVCHLSCPDRTKLVARLKRRALESNRVDDADENVIVKRLKTYEAETKPLLAFYEGKAPITTIDASQAPQRVLHDIVAAI